MATREHEILLNLVASFKTEKGGVNKFVSEIEKQMKTIQPDIDLNSDEFKKKAENVIAEFNKLKNSTKGVEDIEIALNSDEAQAELSSLTDALDQLIEETEKIDTSLIDDAFGDIDTKTLNDLSKALDDLNKNVDFNEASKQFENLVDDFEQGTVETKKLLEAQKDTLKELEKTGKVGTKGYDNLQAEIKETEGMLGQYEEALKKVKDTTDENSKGGNSFLETFFKAEAIATAGEYLSEFAESGKEVNKALKVVQAQAGLTEAEVASLKDSATELFQAGVGETLSDTIRALGTAQQQLGSFLPKEDLDDFVKGAGAIANVMDVEVNEVIGKSRTFLQNFALDGQKGFELIAFASKETNTSMADTLDTLDEYSGVISDFGASAESFVGRLAVGVEQGARDTDKLADAMKETAIRINAGDFTTPFEEMKDGANEAEGAIVQSVEALLKQAQTGDISIEAALNQSQKLIKEGVDAGEINEALRNKLNVAISGTMAEEIGGELFTNIFSADVDTTAVANSAKEIGQTFSDTIGPVTTFDKLELKFKAFATKASSFFAPVASTLGGVITTAGQLAPAVSALNSVDLSKIKDQVSSIQSGISGLGDKVPFIKSQLGSLGKSATGLTGIASKIGALGPIAMNPWVIGGAAAVGALTLFLTKTEKGQAILENASKGFQNFIKQAEPVLDSLKDLGGETIDLLIEVGKIIFEVVILPFEILYEVINAGISIVNEWTGGLLGATDIFELIAKGIDVVSQGFSSAGDFLSGLLGYIKAAKEGIFGLIREAPELLSNLAELGAHYLNPANWFGDDEEGDALKQKIADSVNRAMSGAVRVFEQTNIGNSIEKAFEIKGSLDKQDEIGKLVAKYENATDELEKASLAQQINKEIPGVVSGYKKIIDENGNVTTAMEINVDQAKKLNEAQREAFSEEIKTKQKEFTNGLIKQANQYQENEAKIAKLNEQIVNANTIEKSQELLKERDKLVESQKKEAENVLGLLEDANEKGVITEESYEAVAKAMGKTTDELKEVVKQQTKSEEIAKDQKRSVEDLAAAWNSVNDKLSKTVTEQTEGLSELKRLVREADDPEERARAREQYQKLLQDTRDNVREQKKLNAINEQILIATGQKIIEGKSLFELAKEEIALRERDIQATEQLREIDKERLLLAEGREANAYDEIQVGKLQLQSIEYQRKAWLEVLSAKGLVSEVNFETGDVEFSPKLKKEEKAEVEDAILRFNQQIAQQETNLEKLSLSIKADSQTLERELAELEISQIEFEIEAGIRGASGFEEIIDMLSERLEKQKTEVEDYNNEIVKLEEEKNAKLLALQTTGSDTEEIEAIKNQYNVLINEQRRLYIEAEAKETETYKRIRQNVRENLDYRLEKLQTGLERETDLLNERYDKEIEKISTVNELYFGLRDSVSQETLDTDLSNIDEEFNVRKEKLEEFKELEFLTEDEYNRKIEALEKESLQRRENLQEEFRKKQLIENEIHAELNAIVEREKQVAVLESEQESFNKKLEIFRENVQITDEQYEQLFNAQQEYLKARQLAEDNANDEKLQKASEDAAANLEAINKELLKTGNFDKQEFEIFSNITEGLSKTTGELEEKGNDLNIALQDVTDSAVNILPAIIAGADQQAEDQFRALMARRVTFIQKEIEAFVLQLLLSESVVNYLSGLPYPLNLAALPLVQQGLSAAIKQITTPTLTSLLSFSEGGDITGLYTSPTAIQVGDATQSGNANNREWVANDRNIREIVELSIALQVRNMMAGFAMLENAINGLSISTKLSGEDIEVVLQRRQQVKKRRKF
jgi:hypothetical protein